MRIKFYALLFFVISLSVNAQDNWVISDSTGLGNMSNSHPTNLITFNSKIFAIIGNFSNSLYSSPTGHQGSWSISNGGLPCCSQFDAEVVGKTLDGGGYMYLGGGYGPNTDGKVYSSTDGQNWNLYLNVNGS